ncbi:carboxymuconolactone decarboxylase [Phlyctema vagabunda]|uniref:Carboxymuconolactone decarboxylase n=1 Tax=Phlyctema vagabunda TaxID=108571 RepID=A0ABR4PXX2_9HELO
MKMPPASVVSPSLLASIKKHPHLPQHTWYFITVTTLCMLNRPEEIPAVYKYALECDYETLDLKLLLEKQLKISRRMRESLIKASAVGGIPKAINALCALKEVTPLELRDDPAEFSPTDRRGDIYSIPSALIIQRGQDFFSKVYGKVAKRIMGQMDYSGTEDLGLIARLIYGHLLSNTTVLSPAETSFVLIAGLIPQDVNPQLKGHLRGALNGGASVEEVRAVRETVIKICEASGMTRLADGNLSGWGWKEDIANI